MTWFPVLNGQGFAGTVSSVNAGQQLQNGWYDVSGGVWSISSGLAASTTVNIPPFNNGALVRQPSESTQDERIRTTFVFTANATTGVNEQIYCLIRHNGMSGSSTNCYAAVYAGNQVVIYSVVGGVYSRLTPSTAGVGPSLTSANNGQSFVMEFIASGVNPTSLQATFYDSTGTNQLATITSFSDSTSGLQTAGVMGIAAYAGAGASGAPNPTISAVSTYTDVAQTATNFTITGFNQANIGVLSGPFTITMNGVLNSNEVFTLSDGGSSGTFSNLSGTTITTVTIGAGAISGAFCYTPAVAGNLPITATATGLTSTSALTLQTTASTLWYPTHSTTFSGTVAATATPNSQLQDGWYDVAGNTWSIVSGYAQSAYSTNGSNYTTVTAGPLLRQSSEDAVNGKIVATFQYNSDQPYVVARHNRQTYTGSTTGSVTTCYAAVYAGNALNIYAVVNGTFNQLYGSGNAGQLSTNTTYVLELDVTQNTGANTGTQIIATLYLGSVASANILVTHTIQNDTTSGLQNQSGSLGLASYGAAGQKMFAAAATYGTIPPVATGYTLTGPTSGVVGVASSAFTLASNGTIPTADSSVTVTLSDGGAGGAFKSLTGTTITTVTTAAGGTTYQQFTYTPASTGSATITAANNSSNVVLAAPSAITMAVNAGPVTLGVTSAAAQFSPGNWYGDGGGTPGRGGSAWRQSWNNGAWVKFCWTTGAGTPYANLLLGSASASNSNIISYFLNGKLTDNQAVLGSNGSVSINGLTSSTAYTLQVYLRSSNQVGRWATSGANVVQVLGLQIDGGSTAGTAPGGRPWGMIIGDSITEGIGADATGNADHLCDYAYFVAQEMDRVGYDTCISACGYSGFLVPGDGYPTTPTPTANLPAWNTSPISTSSSDVPPYYSIISGSYVGGSRWNKIAAGVSLLDSNGQISAYGATGTAPSFILLNYGTNEVLESGNSAWSASAQLTDFQAAVIGALTALRAAAPQAVILLMVPFGFYPSGLGLAAAPYRTALYSAMSVYQAEYPGDVLTSLLDLGATVCNTVFLSPGWATSPHPTLYGHSYLAPRVAGALTRALKIQPTPYRSYPFARL